MKKVTSLLLLVGVAAFGLVGCGDDVSAPPEQNIRGVSVTPSTLNIAVGESAPLSADVDGDANNSVSWSSNNTAVATVDANGSVTGVAEGTAAITATSTVDNSQSASATVNVTAAEEAEVSINSIRALSGGSETALDPADVSGRIRVSINVQEGDRTVESVQVLFNDEVAATQTFASGSLGEVEGVQMQGEVAVVTIDANTAQVEGGLTKDGTVQMGAFQNGDQTVKARLVLANGTNVDAEYDEVLSFNNENVVYVTHMGDGNRAVSSNAPATEFWGGATVTFAATPVIYDGSGVGTVTVTDAPADLTFADGATVSEPFLYPVEPADNDAIEDAPGPTNGHDVSFTSATDDEGIALPLTAMESVSDIHLDFAAPVANSGDEEVEIDAAAVTNDWYSAGDFSVAGADDGGVGVPTSAASEFITVDVIDTGTSDTIPGAETVEDDLTERERVYTAEVSALADLLGNATDLSAIATITSAADFGADFGAPTYADVAPNDATFVFNGDASAAENYVIFSTSDPELADETAGSGVATASVAAEVVNATTSDTADVTAAGGGTLDNAGAPDYTLDVSAGTGTALGDGSYVVNVTSPDNAVLDPNVGEQTIEFILDTTAPEFSALDPTPTSTSTGATSVIMNIGGDVTDANAIASATISVYVDGGSASDIQDGGATGSDNGTCETTDYKLDVDAGEIDQNDVDISDGTASFSFSESFEIADPGVSGETIKYCFFVTATDEALDNTGAEDGNTDSIQTNANVEWTS